MNPTRTCPKCAAPLPADAPQGHCPQCLLLLALAAQPGPDTAAALEQATLDSGTAAASESRASGTGTVRLNSPTEKPGDTIGRYKLLQKIGEGGCGTVYMAEQSEPVRRKVALKVIKLGMDTKSVIARFDAERQALAMMDHPNIAKVLDAGATDAGRPYFVMELVRGIPITKYCDENHLDTPARLDLFTAVCSAIQHAHQKGIIHRDIKPSNILVTLHDGVPVPKVIDFGIAKATEARLTDLTLFTELHAFVGTPAYMSPEQAEMSGLDMDTRADIYSLGVLLYELLSGKLPFDPETLLKAGLDEMRRTIREVEPPRPSTRLSTMTGGDLTAIAKHRNTEAAKLSTLLRGDLDWIVMKALEKDRTRRYESASAFAQDIKRYLGNEAVLACPPSAAYLLQKLVRRHRLAFAAGTAVAASLVIGLSVSTWLFFKEKDARERAVQAEQEQVTLRTQADTARANEQKLRVQAEADEAKAKTAAVKSEQVARFMKDMLKGVRSSVALGRDTTMLREVVDKTLERLGTDLKGQPEVEAELRSTLGAVFSDLSDYRKAEPLLRKALELRRTSQGNEHSLVAESLRDVALVLLGQARLSEAESLAREALTICRKLPGEDEAEAESLQVLAMMLTRQANLNEAEPLHREALALYRKVLGADHEKVAGALAELAFNQHGEGKLREAEALYREALAMQKKLFGPEHPELTVTLVSLAFLVEQQGRSAEAEALCLECLAMQRKFFGNEHPHLTTTMALLARLLEKRGKQAEAKAMRAQVDVIRKKFFGNEDEARAYKQFESALTLLQQGKGVEAETSLRETLAAFRKHLAPDNQIIARALGSLGTALGRQQKWAEAESVHREALALWQKFGHGDQPSGAQARFDLAWTLHREGKLAEAETRLREAAVIFKKVMGPEHPAVASTLNLLATTLDKQGKLAERETVLRELLVLNEKRQPDDWQTFDSRSSLGGSLLAQKKYAEAEPLLLSGYEGMKQREEKIPLYDKFRLRKALDSLGQLYEATAQPAKAAEWKGKLQELEDVFTAPIRADIAKAKTQFGAESWEAATAMMKLSQFHLMNEQPDRAEPVAREILRLREKNQPDNVVTFKERSELGAVLTKCGRFAEAEPLLVSGFAGIVQRFDKVPVGNTDYFEPALRRLVDFYEATKQSAKAEEWRQKLRDFPAELKQLCTQRTTAQIAALRTEIAKAKEDFGGESWEVSAALLKLRTFLSQTGQHEQAEPVAREVLRLREKTRPDDVATWKARSELGEVLTKRELFAEAGPLLLSAHEGILQRKDKIKPGDTAYIGPSLKRLVAFYEATAQPANAAEWRQKLAAFEQAGAAKKPAAK